MEDLGGCAWKAPRGDRCRDPAGVKLCTPGGVRVGSRPSVAGVHTRAWRSGGERTRVQGGSGGAPEGVSGSAGQGRGGGREEGDVRVHVRLTEGV